MEFYMGLIKAAISSVGGAFADQWKEFIYCDSIPNDVLAVRGRKRPPGVLQIPKAMII